MHHPTCSCTTTSPTQSPSTAAVLLAAPLVYHYCTITTFVPSLLPPMYRPCTTVPYILVPPSLTILVPQSPTSLYHHPLPSLYHSPLHPCTTTPYHPCTTVPYILVPPPLTTLVPTPLTILVPQSTPLTSPPPLYRRASSQCWCSTVNLRRRPTCTRGKWWTGCAQFLVFSVHAPSHDCMSPFLLHPMATWRCYAEFAQTFWSPVSTEWSKLPSHTWEEEKLYRIPLEV